MYQTPMLRHQLYVHDDGDSGSSAAGAVHVPPLSWLTKATYSVGHVLNDMSAACWFSYLLLYLEEAENLSGTQAGIVLFSGQLFDALATPIVGIMSDKSKGLPSLGLGRRKLWNAGGAIIVTICFLGVFGFCFVCGLLTGREPTSAEKTASYAIFASLFNVGWAAVQVSHMAMVPELSSDDGERVWLNSARYAFTVLSNCAVFVAMYAILHWYKGAGGDAGKSNPQVYQLLTFVVIGIGVCCTFAFLIGTKEKLHGYDSVGNGGKNTSGSGAYGRLGDDDGNGNNSKDENYDRIIGSFYQPEAADNADDDDVDVAEAISRAAGRSDGDASNSSTGDSNARRPTVNPGKIIASSSVQNLSSFVDDRPAVMTWRDWLQLRSFYQVMLVYSLTRLATNCSQVYLPFFVTTTLGMDEVAIALLPLLMYLAQLGATIVMKRIAARLGRRNSLTFGAILCGAACAVMIMLQSSSSAVMYAAVLLLGVGSAIVMVISVSMEADLVGNNTESGAFVYGVCSFADKLSNGLAILAIQTFGDSIGDTAGKATFTRYVNGFVPMVAVALAAAVSWTIAFPKHLQGQTPTSAASTSPAPVGSFNSINGASSSKGAKGGVMRALNLGSAATSGARGRRNSNSMTASLLADGTGIAGRTADPDDRA